MILIIIGIALIVGSIIAWWNDFGFEALRIVLIVCGAFALIVSIGSGITAKIINNRRVSAVVETSEEFDIYLTDGSRTTIDKTKWLNYKFSKSSDVVNIKWDKMWGAGYTDLVLPVDKICLIKEEDLFVE